MIRHGNFGNVYKGMKEAKKVALGKEDKHATLWGLSQDGCWQS